MTQDINRQWRLAARPVGMMKEGDLEWYEGPLPEPEAGQVRVRTVYLSLDPTNRSWVRKRETYLPPVDIGDVMRGITIGVVDKSRSDVFSEGDVVQGMWGWQDYAVVSPDDLTPVPMEYDVPLSAHFGLFGHIGLSAYFGLLEIGELKEDETLVVSAAAGAVGSLAGQIGKIMGCRVVGIAGSDEKCRWLTGELGFDEAINYKTEMVMRRLARTCPDGVDVYFDNVGGDILDAVLHHINNYARIVLCGMISVYNAKQPVPGPYNFNNILIHRARVQGFIVLDYLDRASEAMDHLATWYREGRIQYRTDIVDGLQNASSALNRLFTGANKGKLIVRVSDEPV